MTWRAGLCCGLVVAVNAAALSAFFGHGVFFGTILIGLVLQAGALCLVRSRGKARRFGFWLGFELAGLVAATVVAFGEFFPGATIHGGLVVHRRLVGGFLAAMLPEGILRRFSRPEHAHEWLAVIDFVPQLVVATAGGLLVVPVGRWIKEHLKAPAGPAWWRLRTRLSVRQMMAIVAALALVLGGTGEGSRLWNRRQLFLGFAEKYTYWEMRLRGAIRLRQEITYYSVRQPLGPPPSPSRLAKMRAEAEFYARMRDKYERAAARPWQNLEPDPPPP